MKKIFIFLMICISMIKVEAQCSANFTFSLNATGNVTFSNTSTFTSTNVVFTWNFGDYQSSNSVNPSHTYAGNGIYVVTLNLYDSISNNWPCYSSFSQTIIINNTACLLTAFASTFQSSGGVVYFNDLSSGTIPLTSYTLDYGDNTFSNFVSGHTYSAAGLYTVNLYEENSPSCTSTYSTVINVAVVNCSLTANFNFSINSGTVTYNNTTIGASASANYYWDFDNGNTSSVQNPSAENYLYNGIYTVNLIVTDSVAFWCSSSVTKTIAIINASCYANAVFNLAKDSTQVPNIVWNAYVTYPSNVVSAIWNWGDNTSTNALYPSHTYSVTGVYNICLTVSVSCGSTSTVCISSNIFRSSESMSMAQVYVINLASGIKSNSFSLMEVLLSPNPNSGRFSLDDLGGNFEALIIRDQLGRECYKDTISGLNRFEADVHLPSGIYFIELRSINEILIKKMIISND